VKILLFRASVTIDKVTSEAEITTISDFLIEMLLSQLLTSTSR
jgi:hypothetical protein